MVVNEALRDIRKLVFDRELGNAISAQENFLFTYPLQHEREILNGIKADYLLMSDYWRRGFNDPEREHVYDQLLRRMYVLTMNTAIRYQIRNNAFLRAVYSRTRSSRQDWSVQALRRDMENFVSEVAMLELEPEHTRQEKQKKLFEEHFQLQSDLFDYIWTSRIWTDALTAAFEDILLSPTIDIIDQQLIVSALTLSLLCAFDYNKFRLLMTVYRQATDVRLRQRALVGWALGVDEQALSIYPDVQQMVTEAVADAECLRDITELQMQMAYCMNAENDQQVIQSEILPELMKNNRLKITRDGIEELDDDPLEDVLHPEASEQRMERLEETMNRMVEMQRQGSDIYFGGFSQMKRFPFFESVSNWFVPFYEQHPRIAGIMQKGRGRKFLKALVDHGPFCDSDKYSFVLVYEHVLDKLPANVVELFDHGEASLLGAEMMEKEEIVSPAFIRRIYLQSMYRFFRLYPSRSSFVNPFQPDDNGAGHPLFIYNKVFRDTALQQNFSQLASFFIKRRMYDHARYMLQMVAEDKRDAQFYLMNGNVLMRSGSFECCGLTVRECFLQVLQTEPDNERALVGFARSSFNAHDYERALASYGHLLRLHPEHSNYLLNKAVCLTNLLRYDEAIKILYKLNYEDPDNANVNRVLAWALACDKKYEQAERIYEKLLGQEQPDIDDMLNDGYCLWFKGDVVSAANMFRQYAEASDGKFDAKADFRENETVIRNQGISETEVKLMIDMLNLQI